MRKKSVDKNSFFFFLLFFCCVVLMLSFSACVRMCVRVCDSRHSIQCIGQWSSCWSTRGKGQNWRETEMWCWKKGGHNYEINAYEKCNYLSINVFSGTVHAHIFIFIVIEIWKMVGSFSFCIVFIRCVCVCVWGWSKRVWEREGERKGYRLTQMTISIESIFAVCIWLYLIQK